jgi:hypothetical protein
MKNIIMFSVVFVLLLACNNKNKTVEEIPAAAMEEALENAGGFFQYDYADGNGTVLKIEYSDYVRWIFRKHEQRAYNDMKLSILDQPNGTEIFSLGTKNYFNIVEMALEENLLDQSKKCWFKIKDDEEREGWVQGENQDPYADGLGSFIEIINIGNKNWTVIKLNERNLYAVNGLNVRDKPGLIDTKVLFQFNYNGQRFSSEYYDEMGVAILAMTKEEDTVNDETLTAGSRTDSWIKIRTKDGLEGWAFGGYLEQGDRGGPKIDTPEIIISLMFMYI